MGRGSRKDVSGRGLKISRGDANLHKRIEEILSAVGKYSTHSAAVMMALADTETPNEFPTLRQAGLPFAAGANTEKIFRRSSDWLRGKKVDRELGRDYGIAPLRQLGLVDQVFVVPKSEADEDNLLKNGHRSKSPNNAYVLSAKAWELLEAGEEEVSEIIEEWAKESPERESLARTASISTAHSRLILACTDSLETGILKNHKLVFVDDDDGERIKNEWKQELAERNLLPDLDSRYPDAILVDDEKKELWVVDAVYSDGEIDTLRYNDISNWAEGRGWELRGAVTAYETYKRYGQRQSRHKNIALGTWVWIAENGGVMHQVVSSGEASHRAD